VHEARAAPAAARLPRRKKARREVLIDDPMSGVGTSLRFLGLLLTLFSIIILPLTAYSIPDSANLGGFYNNPMRLVPYILVRLFIIISYEISNEIQTDCWYDNNNAGSTRLIQAITNKLLPPSAQELKYLTKFVEISNTFKLNSNFFLV
jgi:hypothetical protein